MSKEATEVMLMTRRPYETWKKTEIMPMPDSEATLKETTTFCSNKDNNVTTKCTRI